jgi:hemoglobin
VTQNVPNNLVRLAARRFWSAPDPGRRPCVIRAGWAASQRAAERPGGVRRAHAPADAHGVGRRGKMLEAARSCAIQWAHYFQEVAMQDASLYDRLGGEEKIRRIVTDLLSLHKQNPAIFTRYNNAKKSDAEIINLVVDLLGSATGGPQQYTGMDMTTAHKGMNCSEAEFVAVLDDLLAALSKHDIGEVEKAEVLALNYALKDEIVHI